MKGEGCKEEWLRRLRWRCRRGLLELDLWLAAFAENRLSLLTPEECRAFEALLEEVDADLLSWLEVRQPAPANHAAIIERVRTAV